MSNNIELPYNHHNTLLESQFLLQVIHQYNVKIVVQDINIYRNAFVHKSYCTRKNENFTNGNLMCPVNCLPLQEESNERLEFLGDAIINIIIGKYLFKRYPDESEGFLTKMRTKLVNGTMLADLCKFANLPQFILISKQIEENQGRQNKKVLEDCFEAFIGAMYLDLESQDKNAINAVSDWLINLIECNIDFTDLIVKNTNYKDTFLKYFQHTYNYLPKFFELSTENTTSGKIYRIAIKDKNSAVISTGSGQSKKHAENDAALAALQYFGQI
jgi:ribonuclease-3